MSPVRIRAGLLREKIRIERATATQNGFGEPVTTWATHATVRAQVEPLEGREVFDADHQMTRTPVVFRIRYSSDVSDVAETDRIVWKSKTHDIESVAELEGRRKLLEITGVKHG